MKSFDDLIPCGKDLLLKFPCVCFNAGSGKKMTIWIILKNEELFSFVTSKPFTCDSASFASFTPEAEKNFETSINELDSALPSDKAEREEIITKRPG
jgi:hypothetical protein